MIAGTPSRTAIAAAEARATHRTLDPPPIFDDPYAAAFAGDQLPTLAAETIASAGEVNARRGRAGSRPAADGSRIGSGRARSGST
jgi:O-methyltransferase involved in polyketide biosynthesis